MKKVKSKIFKKNFFKHKISGIQNWNKILKGTIIKIMSFIIINCLSSCVYINKTYIIACTYYQMYMYIDEILYNNNNFF